MKFLASRKIFVHARPKKPARMLFLVTVMGLFAVAALLFAEAGSIYRKVEQTLARERQTQSEQNAVLFSRVALTPHSSGNVQIIQSTRRTRAVARFQNSLYAATDGGLLQMTENGETTRHFTVLDGLPESDLTTLAVFGARLYIGTQSKGLINFDGEKFEAFKLENHETKSITALFAASRGSLLIGTFSGGLLEFDGVRITEIKAAGDSIEHVTFLRETDSCLLAGTFANGIRVRKNRIWKHFTTADGLFSNRIVGAGIYGETLFVASDLGVSRAVFAEIERENQIAFRPTVALPTLSGLIIEKDSLFLSKDNGEIFEFPAKRATGSLPDLKQIFWKKPENLQAAKIFGANGEIWLLGSEGIQKSESLAAAEISLTEFAASPVENQLTDNNVSALALDRDEGLWIGTFRRGIDVFSPGGKKLAHLESETAREINFLIPSPKNNQMLAATTGGALRFDRDFNATFFVENAALPSRSVTQIAFFKDGENHLPAISTAKGLLLRNKDSQRVFSTVNGLPSGSAFAALDAGGSLLAATMGGLAQIENGKIRRVFKTSNSGLKNNWISALCRAGERIFVGTYGGGVFELLPSGDVRAFETETGKFFVNPNALFADGERLYAGTLKGIWSLDLTTGQWIRAAAILPAETVLSITGDGARIYVGTTNGIARIDKNFWHENRL